MDPEHVFGARKRESSKTVFGERASHIIHLYSSCNLTRLCLQ